MSIKIRQKPEVSGSAWAVQVHMPPMNIYSPLLGICRGVEADILNHFSHRPHYVTAAQLARTTKRSRTEISKCLRMLDSTGILMRAHPTSHAFALLHASPMGKVLTQFAEMPKRLAEDIAAFAETWHPRPLSVILASEHLSQLLGTENLVFVVYDPGTPIVEHKVHYMRHQINREYRLALDVRIGSPMAIEAMLAEREIDIYFEPLNPATLKEHVVMGMPLKEVLRYANGGTGGI